MTFDPPEPTGPSVSDPLEPAETTQPVELPLPDGASSHPDRYTVREGDDGRYLACVDVPEIRVITESQPVASETAARRAPSGTVFVDGAASAPPFVDSDKAVLNLDHHEGCVRAFTVAACEQALILVSRGLDLSDRPWTIRCIDPDLDAIFAVWVLLNASHLLPDSSVRRRLIPLIRLESVIDVHGLDQADLSGLGSAEREQATESLDYLRERELEARRRGGSAPSDRLDLAAGILREIDRLVFPPGFLQESVDVEVLARKVLEGDALTLVCRSREGIYEVESRLKKTYGRRLAVLALERSPGHYTLRLVDPFLPRDLQPVYDDLNTLDPAVAEGGWRNRWGGSGEIGGSPRDSGTALDALEIAEACRRALRKPSLLRRVGSLTGAAGLAGVGFLGGLLASWQAAGRATFGLPAELALPFALGFGAVATAIFLALSARRPLAFGARRLAGREWLYVLPIAMIAALAGGVWRTGSGADSPALAVTLALGAELLFRGVVHGLIGRSFRVAHAGGRWFLSIPGMASALIYMAAGMALPVAGPLLAAGGPIAETWLRGAALLLFGLSAAVARERSGSVLSPIVLHLVGVGLCAVLA